MWRNFDLQIINITWFFINSKIHTKLVKNVCIYIYIYIYIRTSRTLHPLPIWLRLTKKKSTHQSNRLVKCRVTPLEHGAFLKISIQPRTWASGECLFVLRTPHSWGVRLSIFGHAISLRNFIFYFPMLKISIFFSFSSMNTFFVKENEESSWILKYLKKIWECQ